MDSYISFRYLNKKLLDQYKGLVPVEIEVLEDTIME